MADLARIKRNVAKMAAQNAPETDIDGYIASEGVTVDDVRAFKAADPQTTEKTGRLEPESRGVFRRIDDAVRGAADMLTFGFSDEISAGLGAATGIGGKAGDYEANVAAQRQRDSEGGAERLAGQVGGALLMPGSLATSVPKAIGQGAITGAVYGYGSGDGDTGERLNSAMWGGVAGGVAGGAVRGIANKIGNTAAAKTIPSNDDIHKLATAAFNKADFAGVAVKPQGMKRLSAQIFDDMAEFGYDPALQPGIAAVVNRLEKAGEGNISLKGIDLIRRVAGNAGKDPMNASQRELARRVIDRIDDYLDDIPVDDVLMGNAKEGSKALGEARELWSRLRKSEMVDTAALKAERRAASTGTGGNADNALRQNVRQLLDNPRTARGMSAAEKSAAEQVVRGTAGQNALRKVGRLAPTGVVSGGIGTSLGAAAGSAVGGAPGAAIGAFALPAVGSVAKSAADRMTVKSAERLSQIIRSGGTIASDLSALARGGQLAIPQVTRVENVAKAVGVSVPELAAMVQERIREAFIKER